MSPRKVKKQTNYKEIAAISHGVACDEGSNKPKCLHKQSDAMGMGKSTVLSFLVFHLFICFQHFQESLVMDGYVADRHVGHRCSTRRISFLQVQRQSEAHQDPDQGWMLLHRREPAVQNRRGETFLL